ncbi:MAG: caspase family protein [Bacteroidota bacterium]
MPRETTTNSLLPFKTSHAFIIGNDAYQHVSSLKTAVKDAKDMARLLGNDHKYKVHALYNATKAEMEEMFQKMPSIVKAEDRVIFYFAGHGIAIDSEKDPEGYLVPVDAESKGIAKLVPMDVLHSALLKLPCKHGLLILDCCFAGSFQWSAGFRSLFTREKKEQLYEERFMRFIEHPAWQVITSSASDQKALDLISHDSLGLRAEILGGDTSEAKNSPFAFALRQAIELKGSARDERGNRSDGVITATELYSYIRRIVEEESNKQGAKQSPAIFTLSKHDTKGEFIFLEPGHRLNLPKAPDRNPYQGLKAYGQDEQAVATFFGRTRAIQEMNAKLSKFSILVVSAPSGQGKSSTVKAGLFPFLQQSYAWSEKQFIVLRPGNRDKAKWQELEHMSAEEKAVVLIDQYEEMFTEDEAEREDCEQQLIALTQRIVHYQQANKRPAPLKLVITIRSDFEWRLKSTFIEQESFWDEKLLRYFLYRLPPMELEELREAMVKPAWVIAYDFESEELINQILEEINYAPGALPLLSFTLHQLYKYRDTSKRIFTQNAYENKLGGINGALGKYANQVYNSLPDEAHKDFMRKIFLRMVRLNDGSYSRRRIYLRIDSKKRGVSFLDELNYPDHLDATKDAVLEILEQSLLIIADQDEFGPYVEPMHDSLINFWPRCLEWIQEFGRENLVLQRQLWQAVIEHHQWEKNIYGTADGGEAAAPLWNDHPKLQQVQIAVTDPHDEWLCKKGWANKRIDSIAYLLWEQQPTHTQMEEMAAWNWYFQEENDEIRYQNIRNQMDHWLNEEELRFVEASFRQQREEIEQLQRDYERALAAAESAKALVHLPADTLASLSKEMYVHRTLPTEEFAEELIKKLKDPTGPYYDSTLSALGNAESYEIIYLYESGEWVVKCGMLDGIPLYLDGQVRIDIFGPDEQYIGKAMIQKPSMNLCYLEVEDGTNLSFEQTYQGIFPRFPAEPEYVHVQAIEEEGKEMLDLLTHQWDSSLNILMVTGSHALEKYAYEFEAFSSGYHFRNNGRLLVTISDEQNEDMAKRAMDAVKLQVGQHRVARLNDPMSRIRPALRFSLKASGSGREAVTASPEMNIYSSQFDFIREPIQFHLSAEVEDLSEQLYFYLMMLGDDASIQEISEEIIFHPGDAPQIDLQKLRWRSEEGDFATVSLKLFVSTHPIPHQLLVRKGIRQELKTRALFAEEQTNYDWEPISIPIEGAWCSLGKTLTFIHPKDSIRTDQQCSLLDGQVDVLPHPALQAKVAMVPTQDARDSYDPTNQLSELSTEEFHLLSWMSEEGNSYQVLEAVDISGNEADSLQDQPLCIRLKASIPASHEVVAVCFHNNRFRVIGEGNAEADGYTLFLTEFPTPSFEPKGNTGLAKNPFGREPIDPSLLHALKIGFFVKEREDPLPLGIQPT